MKSSANTRVLVSVVIPCFNAERWIAETLASVQKQTLPSEQIELVVVDDGSTDNSVAVIQQCRVPTLKLLRTRNHGVSHARNLGTAESTGKFIQYLDADDLLCPEALSKRTAALDETGADVAYSAWRRLVENEKGDFSPGETICRRIEDVNVDVELAVFSSFWSPPVALLYRRSIVERIGAWNAKYSVIQDARFLQDAAHCGATFTFLDEVLGEYRTHRGASLSTRSKLQLEKDIFFNNEEIETRWLRAGPLSDARRAYLCRTYRRSAKFFFWNSPDLFEAAHRHSLSARTPKDRSSSVDLYAWMVNRCGLTVARRFLEPIKFLGQCSRSVLRFVLKMPHPNFSLSGHARCFAKPK